MRFTDLLRATVLLCAGAASALMVVTLLAAGAEGADRLAQVATAFWALCLLAGLWLSRRHEASPPVAHLLADARAATMMPEIRPAAMLLNRIWPILLVVLTAIAICRVVGPQVPALVAGATIVWALAWRRQAAAVSAIEERDGVTFYLVRTSPVRRIRLERVPGFRRERMDAIGDRRP